MLLSVLLCMAFGIQPPTKTDVIRFQRELKDAIAISPDFKLYALRTTTGKNPVLYGASIVEVSDGKQVKVLEWDHDWNHPHSGLFSANGSLVALKSGGGQAEGSVKILDVETGTLKLNIRHPLLENALFLENPKHVLSYGGPGASNAKQTLWLWDISTRKYAVLEAPTKPTCIAASPDGKQLACAHGKYGSKKPYLTLWRLGQNSLLRSFERKGDEDIVSLSYSPDSKSLAIGMRGGTVRVVDLSTNKEVASFNDLQDDLFSVAFHPDGTHVAATGKDKTIRVWNIRNKELISTTKLPKLEYYLQLRFSRDGKQLASYTTSGVSITLWTVELPK